MESDLHVPLCLGRKYYSLPWSERIISLLLALLSLLITIFFSPIQLYAAIIIILLPILINILCHQSIMFTRLYVLINLQLRVGPTVIVMWRNINRPHLCDCGGETNGQRRNSYSSEGKLQMRRRFVLTQSDDSDWH